MPNSEGLSGNPLPASKRQIVVCFSLLAILTGAMAALLMLTGFSPWDDEGMIMRQVQRYLSGMKLYEQVSSFYGPAYFNIEWLLRTITRTPVTHDVTRLSALLPWIATALLAGWAAFRLTGSLALGALTEAVAALGLRFFTNEPGHPQELTVLLLVLLAAAPLLASLHERRKVLMAGMGALVATLLWMKINAGASAAAALMMVLAACLDAQKWRRWLGLAAGAACVALALALMRSPVDASWARSYCWLEAASIAACVCCMLRFPGCGVRLRDGWTVAAACTGVSALCLGLLASQGVSPLTVYEALVTEPARVFTGPGFFFVPLALSSLSPFWTAAGLLTAAFVAWRRPAPDATGWRFLMALKVLHGCAALALLLSPLLFEVTLPFAWLIILDPNQDSRMAFPRRWLAILAVLQGIYAFPVAGSQALLIRIIPLILAAVAIKDALPAAASSGWAQRVWLGKAVSYMASAGAVVLLVFGVGQAWAEWEQNVSLDLPGARLLRVSRRQKQDFQWLARNLKEGCDTFAGFPGLLSLYYWTGMEPPPGHDADSWTKITPPAKQRLVIAALEGHPRACIVYHPRLAEMWNPSRQDLSGQPLVAYIRSNFRRAASTGNYQLLIRNERRDFTPVDAAQSAR